MRVRRHEFVLVRACVCLSMCVCVRAFGYVRVFEYVHVFECVCVCVCVFEYVRVCLGTLELAALPYRKHQHDTASGAERSVQLLLVHW